MENVNNVFRFYERQLFCRIRNVKYEIQMIENSLYSFARQQTRLLCANALIHASADADAGVATNVDYSSRTMKCADCVCALSFTLNLHCFNIQ